MSGFHTVRIETAEGISLESVVMDFKQRAMHLLWMCGKK
jgi:hypothetical protein